MFQFNPGFIPAVKIKMELKEACGVAMACAPLLGIQPSALGPVGLYLVCISSFMFSSS